MNKPSVYLDGLPRTTPRAVWRALYRLARVTVREAAKAADDVSISLQDGSVHLEKCTPDEGARAFWDAVQRTFPRPEK